MEISRFHVMITSKVGADFDIPRGREHRDPHPFFFIIVNQVVVHSRLVMETMLGG